MSDHPIDPPIEEGDKKVSILNPITIFCCITRMFLNLRTV